MHLPPGWALPGARPPFPDLVTREWNPEGKGTWFFRAIGSIMISRDREIGKSKKRWQCHVLMSCLRFEKLTAAVGVPVIKLVWFLVTKRVNRGAVSYWALIHFIGEVVKNHCKREVENRKGLKGEPSMEGKQGSMCRGTSPRLLSVHYNLITYLAPVCTHPVHFILE